MGRGDEGTLPGSAGGGGDQRALPRARARGDCRPAAPDEPGPRVEPRERTGGRVQGERERLSGNPPRTANHHSGKRSRGGWPAYAPLAATSSSSSAMTRARPIASPAPVAKPERRAGVFVRPAPRRVLT